MNADHVQKREISRIPGGMRPGRRELNSASLTVQICQVVPEHMRERTREITHVHVPIEDRRRRLATALMNFVCQEADANQLVLLLTARPYEEDDESAPDEEQLVRWYGRFGFQTLQDNPDGTLMARQPRKPLQPAREIVDSAIRRAIASSRG